MSTPEAETKYAEQHQRHCLYKRELWPGGPEASALILAVRQPSGAWGAPVYGEPLQVGPGLTEEQMTSVARFVADAFAAFAERWASIAIATAMPTRRH